MVGNIAWACQLLKISSVNFKIFLFYLLVILCFQVGDNDSIRCPTSLKWRNKSQKEWFNRLLPSTLGARPCPKAGREVAWCKYSQVGFSISVSAGSGKVLWQKKVKSPFSCAIFPLTQTQVDNQKKFLTVAVSCGLCSKSCVQCTKLSN